MTKTINDITLQDAGSNWVIIGLALDFEIVRETPKAVLVDFQNGNCASVKREREWLPKSVLGRHEHRGVVELCVKPWFASKVGI